VEWYIYVIETMNKKKKKKKSRYEKRGSSQVKPVNASVFKDMLLRKNYYKYTRER